MGSWYTEQPYLQWSGQTRYNRFPKLFARAKELKPEPKRVLSFGCSTGEECFALAELYPDAEIVGVDVNSYSLERARRDNKYPDRIFFHDNLGATGKYDLVTSFMVLFSMWQPISLEKWKETVASVDKHINNDAVWMIYMSQFPFDKAELGYEKIKEWRRRHPKDRKIYHCGYYKKS